jgi:hypothetical protein
MRCSAAFGVQQREQQQLMYGGRSKELLQSIYPYCAAYLRISHKVLIQSLNQYER